MKERVCPGEKRRVRRKREGGLRDTFFKQYTPGCKKIHGGSFDRGKTVAPNPVGTQCIHGDQNIVEILVFLQAGKGDFLSLDEKEVERRGGNYQKDREWKKNLEGVGFLIRQGFRHRRILSHLFLFEVIQKFGSFLELVP